MKDSKRERDEVGETLRVFNLIFSILLIIFITTAALAVGVIEAQGFSITTFVALIVLAVQALGLHFLLRLIEELKEFDR